MIFLNKNSLIKNNSKIKEDYNFDEIKDAFDEGAFPHQLDFFYGGENSNLNQAIELLSPSNENREFIAFLLTHF